MTAPAQAQDRRLPPRAQWPAARSSRALRGTHTVSVAPRLSADLRVATRRSDRTLEARW